MAPRVKVWTLVEILFERPAFWGLSFSAYWWHCHRVERAANQWWLSVSTMVLSEARGLELFRVIRDI